MRIERPLPSAVDTAAPPRSTRELQKLLRHGNWIRSADLKHAVRKRYRPHFGRDVALLWTTGLVERRMVDDGLATELRLTPRHSEPHTATNAPD